MLKVEEVVAGTNTGKSPQLASYYQYWERAIFAALNTMVLSAMNNFHNLIKACNTKKAKDTGQVARTPLFKVLLQSIRIVGLTACALLKYYLHHHCVCVIACVTAAMCCR
jgi:dynein heavy chain, axonemal